MFENPNGVPTDEELASIPPEPYVDVVSDDDTVEVSDDQTPKEA